MDIMVKTIIRQEEQIGKLIRQMIDQHNRSMRKNVVISVIVEEYAETCQTNDIQKVQDFIQDMLQVHDEIEIRTVHCMEIHNENRSMVAKLKNFDDKKKLFEACKQL